MIRALRVSEKILLDVEDMETLDKIAKYCDCVYEIKNDGWALEVDMLFGGEHHASVTTPIQHFSTKYECMSCITEDIRKSYEYYAKHATRRILNNYFKERYRGEK